jgi:histone-lysine N-methyltransferase SETD8
MYYFSWNSRQWCIDATVDTGRYGRLINHSRKTPNCKSRLFIWNDTPHLVFFALTDIGEGVELLYDYGDTRRVAMEAHPWLKAS